jgi:hypothetical protein
LTSINAEHRDSRDHIKAVVQAATAVIRQGHGILAIT